MTALRRAALVLLVLALAAAAWVWASLRPPAPPEPLAEAFVLPDVTVVNPGRGHAAHGAVHVAEGRIQSIAYGEASAADARRLDRYAGHFLLPGLVDLHVHLPPSNPLQLTRWFALLHLLHGVTSVRDAGDMDGSAVAPARAIAASGGAPSPRVFACGPFVGGDPPLWPNTLVVDGPEAARQAVRRVHEAGFDCAKAYEHLSAASLRALVDEAERLGLPVIGHVPADLTFEEARVPDTQHLLGVAPPESVGEDLRSRLSHWEAVDDRRLEQVVEATLRHELAHTPTLVASFQQLRYADYPAALRDPATALMPRFYREVVWSPEEGLPFLRTLSPERLERVYDALVRKRELVARLFQAGARIHLGTDASVPFVIPGAAVHQEMRLFHEIGIPPEAVWAIATRVAGEALGVPDLGTLVPGAPADLLVFRRDPTADLAHLDTLEAVVAGGRLYTIEALEAHRDAWLEHFEGAIFDGLSVRVARAVMRGLEDPATNDPGE